MVQLGVMLGGGHIPVCLLSKLLAPLSVTMLPSPVHLSSSLNLLLVSGLPSGQGSRSKLAITSAMSKLGIWTKLQKVLFEGGACKLSAIYVKQWLRDELTSIFALCWEPIEKGVTVSYCV
jgi:hypothetical protein